MKRFIVVMNNPSIPYDDAHSVKDFDTFAEARDFCFKRNEKIYGAKSSICFGFGEADFILHYYKIFILNSLTFSIF